ncbi:trans-resveratrol di-O-methyltransferase-like [Humulus lupulus]|uniref:trans-resveratrol di-O-methyltransferase-like n=1 Tax=Humulus lupulus TaxID=3486 RepID=UPI002B41370D|nr:trans-resveratrol di-O-methyltransferase-like [Humulus lupulus]
MNLIKGEGEVSSNKELLQAQELLWHCTFSFIKPMSLKCAIELGIADIIHNHGQPITLSKLISSLPIHSSKAHCIQRLMRILVHFGIFSTQAPQEDQQEEKEEEKYYLTLTSRLLLLKDGPFRATQFCLAELHPRLLAPWQFLSTWLQKGDDDDPTPFKMVHGMNFWDDLPTADPTVKCIFTEAMASDSHLISKVIVEDGKKVFEGLSSLVDVGGGAGIMAKAIANAFTNIKCTVLDLPYVVADLKGTHNLNFVEGDMFKKIPSAHAVLLKWVLHNWSDEEATIILKKCREAIIESKDEGGKVIVIDMIIDENSMLEKKLVETQLYFDMLMMINVTGKERNKKQWENLFLAAGFSHHKITPIEGLRSIIEVYP